jgi:arylformamidase
MRIYDVSVPLCASTPTFPGDPGIVLEQWAALDNGAPANVTMLHFGTHTGTHVDAPAHFISGAPRVEAMPLEVLIGRAHVVEIPHATSAIERSHIEANNLDGATRVLFKTRNSDFWADLSQGFRTDFTYLTPGAARALADSGVRLVGIDYLSVEKFESSRYETHTILLERGVVIVEGLDLREVTAGVYELICLPLKIADGTGDGAPARAVLRSID